MSLVVRRLLLAAGATVVAVLLGGVILVAVARMRDVPVPLSPFRPAREDAVLGSVLHPDWQGRHLTTEFDVQVRTNAFGQRGAPRTPEKAPGVRRILLLGDSFAFGWGVEEDETFAVRLGALLSVRGDAPDANDAEATGTAGDTAAPGGAGGAVEIIDTGVPGWNAANAYLWLLRSGFDWQPDVVLLQLCSNDLMDFAFFDYDFGARNLPVAIRTRPRLDAAARQRLIAAAAAEQHLTPEQLAQRLSPAELNELAGEGIEHLQAARRDAAGAPPEGPLELLPAEEVRRGLDTGPAFRARYLRHVVDAIAELCTAHGVPLRLLTVDARTPDDDEDRAALAALCADAGGHCLSSEAFLPREEFEPCFFRLDPHWTAEGHRRAAEALAAWLAADPELPFARR